MSATTGDVMMAAGSSDETKPGGLALSHLWVSVGLFLVAALLGLYQVAHRAGFVPAWDEGYYVSVSTHGTIMGFVFTTFFIVGFGYYTAATSLNRPIWGKGLAWFGWGLMVFGTLMAALTLLTGNATVLYTFYPPAIAHWGYYIGAALLIVGSLPWALSMVMMSTQWKADNPGKPIPLAMFGTTINALLWVLTIVGVVIEVLFQLIPASLGLVDTIDVGLARTLFSWTLHPIVYFWLIPAYIALYSLMPKAAGGRLFSDEMARVAFIMILVFGLPIGFHHLYMDPFQDVGWKLLHAFGTFMVAIPTFITGFTVIASMEIAGRMRGGTGLFGWLGKVDYGQPLVLASGLALLVLALGGFGGVVNASYQMNVVVHNTMWVPAHFHAIFGGTVALVYFGTMYHLWPSMTGRQLSSPGLARAQLWLWGIGILILTVPWHAMGLLGAPRRTAFAAYSEEYTRPWLMHEHMMVLGGVLLLISSLLLVWVLLRSHGGSAVASREVEYAEAVHPPLSLPKALNGYSLWFWITVVYLVVSFGYPIGQFFIMDTHDPVLWGW